MRFKNERGSFVGKAQTAGLTILMSLSLVCGAGERKRVSFLWTWLLLLQVLLPAILPWMDMRCLAQEEKMKMSGVENYAINRAGVVMIRTEYSATVYVNKMRMDQRAFDALLDSIQRLDNAGSILAEQKLDIVLKEMNNRPARFFQATFDYIKQAEQITATGTGFFVTGSGFVATNCHLIERDNAFIRRQFILSAFQNITEANIAALESAWATTFNEQQRSLLYTTYASVYSRLFSMILYDLKKNIYVVGRADRENTGPGIEKSLATVTISGKPMPGKDIALLKIETDREMPVLSIGEPKLPEVGEQLYVYGYPGPVTSNDFVSSESAIEPTLTTGIVSALKKSVAGWPVIQMDANINHGSSGGPVCNEQGKVVGLTTFGSLENSGGLAAGLNFAIPVTILKEYLDSAGVVPKVGKATRWFNEAVQLFRDHYYGAALRKFEDVRSLNRYYPGLYTYMADCKENIKRGANRELGPVGHLVFIGGGLIVLLAACIGVILWKKKS